jgi:SAM-dependent methyltransferase
MLRRSERRAPALERAHFERVVAERGRIYWVDRTAAGARRREIRARLLVDASATAAGDHALEIGCGAGEFSRAFEQVLSARLVSVDVAPTVAAAARAATGPNVEVVAADVERLPFADASFDAVIGNGVLHHLRLDRGLVELQRVLRPGGRLCFAEPNWLNPHVFVERSIPFVGRWLDASPGETAFTRWGLDRVVRAAGFTEVVVRPFDFLYPLVPARLVKLVERMGRRFETLPLVREVAGSLLLTARRPLA